MRFIIKRQLKQQGQLFIIGCLGCLSCLFSSCSKEETEPGEFDNWKARNEAYFASLTDSMRTAPAQWKRIAKFSLAPEIEGKATDYIYAKVISSGDGVVSPNYTDSVRVIYEGRLIPSATFPKGYVFDTTVGGNFSIVTASTTKMLLSTTVDGYATALQHMHRGDHWRIFIPSDLGYGENGTSSGSVPAYSTIIFDVMLIDFSPAGTAMPQWSSRMRR